MFASERQAIIYSNLRKNGSVRNSELVDLFQVTPMTIRRDLDELEARNLIKRVQGGAVLIGSAFADISFSERREQMVEQKLAIAREAMKFLREGMCIGLDASSTVLEIARLLPEINNLKVVTNSLNVAWELKNAANVEVILTGGVIAKDGNTIGGMIAAEQSTRMYLDVAILSCTGFDELGITNASVTGSEVRLNLVQNSSQRIVLADSSKFNKRGLVRLFEWDKINILVSDDQLSSEAIETISSKHPELQIQIAKPFQLNKKKRE